MDTGYDGLGLGLGNLARLSAAETRSISAENPTGAKGAAGQATQGTGAIAARELGQGWKISPSINLPGKTTVTLADVDGPGAIQQIWLTLHPSFWRRVVLRIYWDDETTPSVETPIGDFFCNGWGVRSNVTSLPVAVNPAGGFNCYWEMPFRQHARITVENVTPDTLAGFYYQINYTLTEVAADRAYFHAQWRRSNPVPYGQVHILLDGVRGQGHYVGTYLAWGVNNNGWWGEGEIKFYLDGDQRLADHLRHRHRGLLRRRLGLRAATGPVLRLLLPVQWAAAGDQARWTLPEPAALWHVSLARDGPGALPPGPAGDHPGAGLALPDRRQFTLSAAARRHRLDRLLVPGGASRALPVLAGRQRAGSNLKRGKRRKVLDMLEKVKVGIVGCGNISPAYFKGCRAFNILEVVACADLDPQRARTQRRGIRRRRVPAASPSCWQTPRSRSSST